ncbi:MAG: rhodanese-related sulfurtransferase [Proteobacteria bacterium]|jgi:hypothetical protein|nr:immunity 53 family protein [Alphaproteobacteria bacterium]NCC02819.1 rhodanese-related sulfurtransferase [Pseudomonadota bacterium]
MTKSQQDALQRLQQWYTSHCNGGWEHNSVIKIESMDNPGWHVSVDIYDTELADEDFQLDEKSFDDGRWYRCYIENGKFIAFGGPRQLEELITLFLDWAEAQSTPITAE